jgi:hypothetical protein
MGGNLFKIYPQITQITQIEKAITPLADRFLGADFVRMTQQPGMKRSYLCNERIFNKDTFNRLSMV